MQIKLKNNNYFNIIYKCPIHKFSLCIYIHKCIYIYHFAPDVSDKDNDKIV